MVKCWIYRSEGESHSGIPAFYINRKNLPIRFDTLFLQSLEGGVTQDKIRRGLLIVLVASLLREIEQERFFRWLPQGSSLTETDQTDPVTRARDHIRRHLSEPQYWPDAQCLPRAIFRERQRKRKFY